MIGGSEDAFHFDARVNLAGKGLEFAAVHVPAMELLKAPAEPGNLCGTVGHVDDHLLFLLLYLIAHENGPGKELQDPDKAFEPLLFYFETGHEVLGRHLGDPGPYLFVEALSRGLVETLGHIEKPEGIDHAVVPKQEFQITAKLVLIHFIEFSKFHGAPFSYNLSPKELVFKEKRVQSISMWKCLVDKGAFILSLLLCCALPALVYGKEPSIPYRIAEKTYQLLIADTPEKWERGLMFKKAMEEDGMIFLFPEKRVRSFWNMNTYLDLDIYWMDGDRVVGKDLLPSITKTGKVVTIVSPGPVNRVIEIVIRDGPRRSK